MVLRELPVGSVETPRRGRISVLSGSGLTVSESCEAGNATKKELDSETKPDVELQLSPDAPVVIGRKNGRGTPYLDPAYSSTSLVPGTSQSVLHSRGSGDDLLVSRAHFMLRHAAGGIVLVNGVPRVGGGIRPPLNGTRLQSPTSRELAESEEFLIERGTSAILRLPNGTEVEVSSL
jgi:hypothetical protein